MSHLVKCKYCNVTLDTETSPFIKLGARYAHQKCAESASVDDSQREQLKEYINKLFKKRADWPKIGKQIKELTDQGYTLTGIYYTLQYLYEVKKEDIKKANGGIGIIPYKYNEAREYYRRENNTFTVAKKVKNNEIQVEPKTTSQVIITKKKIEAKKDKLLDLDI